jgi:hypothetical protein
LHATILVTVAVGFFTPAMLVLYLAFVSSDTIRKLPDRVKHLVRQRSQRWRKRRIQSGPRPRTADHHSENLVEPVAT